MIKTLLAAFIAMALMHSCLAKEPLLKELFGKWIVHTEQRFIEQDGKRIETFPTEKVDPKDAYVYHFKSDTLLTISNIAAEFEWDFKIIKTDSVLTLININGDAEDDELIYNYNKGKLTLLRKMEGPDEDDNLVYVCDLMQLSKM